MALKGLIFDMDGLLLDTEKLYCKANLTIAPKYGITTYDEAYYMKYVGTSDEELYEAYYQDFAEFGRENIEGFIKEAHEEVKALFLAGKAELKPGAIELLDYLKEQEIPCVVASSNLRSFITILLDKAGITSYFSGVISGEDVKRAKPDPEIVEKAASMLQLAPKDCLMLEDSFNGVIASSEAGVPVIMIPDLLQPTPEIKERTLEVFPSLYDVKNYLAE